MITNLARGAGLGVQSPHPPINPGSAVKFEALLLLPEAFKTKKKQNIVLNF